MTALREQIAAFILEHPTAFIGYIADACGCSKSTAKSVRSELVAAGRVGPLPKGAAAHESSGGQREQEKPMKEEAESGRASKLKERIDELEAEVQSYQDRLTEVQEVLVDTVIEQNRLRRILSAQQEAEATS